MKLSNLLIGEQLSMEIAHLQPLRNVPTNHRLPTLHGFRDIAQTKYFKVKVTMARSKVKSRSHHDIVHLHHLNKVPTKYQLPTPYGFRDRARKRFYRSRSLWQVQIKVIPLRCTPISPNQCPYQVSNYYTLQFPR